MAQTPAEPKKCQALFLGSFIKYDNNVFVPDDWKKNLDLFKKALFCII